MREFTSDEPDPEVEAGITLPAVTIGLDGEKFTCVRELDGDGLLEWSELAISASEDVAADSPEGAAAIARFLRVTFGPEEYQRFRRHVRAHHTTPAKVMKVVAGLQEEITEAIKAATGRPTEQPSPSSPGDAGPDERTSRIISLQRGDVVFADPPPTPGDHKGKGGTRRRAASSGG